MAQLKELPANPVRVTVEAHRGILPIFWKELDGHRYVRFCGESNFSETIELPAGSVPFSEEDMLERHV